MYKEKYLKYKIKYLKLVNKLKYKQNNLIKQSGGSNKFLEKYSNISKKQFNSFFNGYSNTKYFEYKSFIESCDEIENCLKQIKKMRKLNRLYVICPGDSPFKFYAYFILLEKCNFCKFISFPFSRTKNYNKEITYNYLDKFIPSNFKNIVIMDSICKGQTINMLIDSMEIKNNLEVNNELKNNNKKIINDIKEELINKLENKQENKYIINLYDFINMNLEETLFVSEIENLRCLEPNPDHSSTIQEDKYDDILDLILHSDSIKFKKYSFEKEDLYNPNGYIKDLYNSNCLDWIKKVCIAKLNWKWYLELEKHNDSKDKEDLNDFDNKPQWFIDLINKYQQKSFIL